MSVVATVTPGLVKALRSSKSRAVADVLARAREQERLSQRELAALLEGPHSVVGMIESHQRQVNVPELIAIAEALDADATELFRQVLRVKCSLMDSLNSELNLGWN